MSFKFDVNREITNFLLHKYSSNVMSLNDIAHELKLGLKTLRNYDFSQMYSEIQQEKISYSVQSFIEFINTYSHQTDTVSSDLDKNIFFINLNWLSLKFDRLMITKNEFLTLIKDIKLDRLNDRIKERKDIPAFFKYRTFRFNIIDVALYLTKNNYSLIEASRVTPIVSIDTLRIYIQNFPADLLLKYFIDNGCKYNEKKYSYEVFYPTNSDELYSPMFRISTVYLKNAHAGCSIELYGLKTYNHKKDCDRKYQYNTLLQAIEDMQLKKRTYITGLDLAYDFPIKHEQVHLFNNKNNTNNIIKNHLKDLRYYIGKLEYLTKFQKLNPSVKTISLESLHASVLNRFNYNTPNIFEKAWFDELKRIGKIPTIHSVNRRWLNYDYDILTYKDKIKIRYSYMHYFNTHFVKYKKHQIQGLKLNRLDNRVNIYDKSNKENLSKALTRVEFTFNFQKNEKISFDTFEKISSLNEKLKMKLLSYNLFINEKIFDLTTHLL